MHIDNTLLDLTHCMLTPMPGDNTADGAVQPRGVMHSGKAKWQTVAFAKLGCCVSRRESDVTLVYAAGTLCRDYTLPYLPETVTCLGKIGKIAAFRHVHKQDWRHERHTQVPVAAQQTITFDIEKTLMTCGPETQVCSRPS